MKIGTFLKLGRVSNLPTVWTNALAGAVLAGQTAFIPIMGVGLALSFFYIGGMWLNDAFDANIDTRERADRPIPMGEISRGAVFVGGFTLLAAGVAFAFLLGGRVGLAGLGLAVVVIVYDWLHKRTVFSPMIMGCARFFCYLVAALAVGQVTGWVILGALGLLAYTAGLTYAAKQEAYDRLDHAWPLAILGLPLLYSLMQAGTEMAALAIWAGLMVAVLLALQRLFRKSKGDVPKAVVTLIAGMSLYDGVLVSAAGQNMLALLCVICFGLTLALQKVVPGT